jgi:hypothetical protein
MVARLTSSQLQKAPRSALSKEVCDLLCLLKLLVGRVSRPLGRCGVVRCAVWLRLLHLSAAAEVREVLTEIGTVGLGRHQHKDWRRLTHDEMRQRCGHNRHLADARGFQDGDALDLRVGNALLKRIQADRPRLGGGASGQADVLLDPAREAASLASLSHCSICLSCATP